MRPSFWRWNSRKVVERRKPLPPEEPGLSVVIDKHGGVDKSPVARDERTADGVCPRALRTVCHSHADAVQVLGGVFSGHIPVPLAVALDGLRGPGSAHRVRPRVHSSTVHDPKTMTAQAARNSFFTEFLII